MTDQTKTKTCTGCGYSKPLEEFYPRPSSPDGHTARCKPCLRAARRAHYAENREAVQAQMRAAYRAKIRAIRDEIAAAEAGA